MTQQIKQPTLFQALIPLVALVIMLASSVYFFGEDSSYGPNQIALWIAAGIACIIGFKNGFSWEQIYIKTNPKRYSKNE